MSARATDLLRPSLTVAAVPVAPAVGVTLGLAIPPPIRDEMFSVTVLTSAVAMAMCSLVWLQLVRWTLGRVLGTASASAVVLVHLGLWLPVWDVGCVNDVLITGQGLTLLGLWAWFVPLIWWAGTRYWAKAGRSRDVLRPGEVSMRGIPTGYMRAVALVPLVCGVYVMVFLLLDDLTGWSENVLWVIANVMGASVVALGWVLAWRRGVRWTPLLRRETGILCAGLVVFCGCSGLIDSTTDWIDSLRVNLPLLVAGVFMVVTAWRWQGRSAALAWDEDEVQPHCVACGYNMTGLHQARCPECGRSYTLDELFEANVGMG